MRRLAFVLGVVLAAGCRPVYVCDEFSEDKRCGPLQLRCAAPGASQAGLRIDLTQPFSIGASELLKDALAAQAPSLEAAVQLEFLEGEGERTTGWLEAAVLPPQHDDELRLELTPAAKQALAPRRGGGARLRVKLGRWTGETSAADEPLGCNVVIEPRYKVDTTGRVNAQRVGLGGLQPRLFAGRRTDCPSVMTTGCEQSAALYASYYESEPSTRCLQLERFVVDAKASLLRADPQLPQGFRNAVSRDDRLQMQGASVVAQASQLVVRASSSKLIALLAADLGAPRVLASPPLPGHATLQGSFELDRFFLGTMTGDVQTFELPAGAPQSMLVRTNSLGVPSPYRLFERAQRPWAASPQPELMLLGDLGAVRLLCGDSPAAACDTMQLAAQKQLTSTPLTAAGATATDLDVLLGDLDADGLQDLVALNRKTGALLWSPQLPGGELADLRALDLLPSAQSFAVADFDGDGLLDVAVLAAKPAQAGAELSVFMNQALRPAQ